jgi:lipopolysaccharide/colanic/teichoic acid biosynthesis glycosyltransferase
MAHDTSLDREGQGFRPDRRRRRVRRFERLTQDGVSAASRADQRSIRRISPTEEVVLRAINMVVAAVAVMVLSPVIIAIAVLIRLDSAGPVFYRQIRVGLDRRTPHGEEDTIGRRASDMGGKPFEIVKFRTMRLDAESDSGPVWASDDDPRVTRVGRMLRRTRMDEIPQFWNVLRGEMSIVGPRPERPTFVQQLRDEIEGYPLRQQVPPGITGWAQVNRPPDQTVEDVRRKVGFDLEYLNRRSVWFDLWIMMKTFPVMFERDSERRPR